MGRLPKLVKWWAGRIMQEKRKKKEDAIAIAVEMAQEKGYLHKHSIKLTKRGLKASRKYYGKRLPKKI